MIFQEPTTSLNPCFTIGFQLVETLRLHLGAGQQGGAQPRHRAAGAGRHSRPPHRASSDYPHQLSGGMNQRVMIAMAIACNPRLLIADEPTTALDVTIQAQILDLLRDLQKERGMALVLITHNMGVVARDGAARGRDVRRPGDGGARVDELFAAPQHPYTAALLAALPERAPASGRLATIPGVVPGLHDRPAGCLFAPRCAYATAHCARRAARRCATGRAARCAATTRWAIRSATRRSRATATSAAVEASAMSAPPAANAAHRHRRAGPRPAARLRASAAACSASRRSCRRWAASPSRSRPAARWRWSANRAAASRRWRAWSSLIEKPTGGHADARRRRCGAPRRRRSGASCARRCSWCSRIPTARSIRARRSARSWKTPLDDQHRRSARPSARERARDDAGAGRPAARALRTAIRTCSPAASASASRSRAR